MTYLRRVNVSTDISNGRKTPDAEQKECRESSAKRKINKDLIPGTKIEKIFYNRFLFELVDRIDA